MTKLEKQTLIEVMKNVLKDESKDYKMHFTHQYITKHLEYTYKDYYDIMNAMYEEY